MEKETNKPEEQISTEQAKPIIGEQKVSRILLEILVYGIEEDKNKIKKLLDELQKQLMTKNSKRRARVLWYVDKGEKTDEEKAQWLFDNCKSKYYIFAHAKGKYFADKNFVRDALIKIKRFEDSYLAIKNSGICVSKNKIEPKEALQQKEEIESAEEKISDQKIIPMTIKD
jgi:hypothetical protein